MLGSCLWAERDLYRAIPARHGTSVSTVSAKKKTPHPFSRVLQARCFGESVCYPAGSSQDEYMWHKTSLKSSITRTSSFLPIALTREYEFTTAQAIQCIFAKIYRSLNATIQLRYASIQLFVHLSCIFNLSVKNNETIAFFFHLHILSLFCKFLHLIANYE